MTNIFVRPMVQNEVAHTVVQSLTTRTVQDTAAVFTAPERIDTRPTIERLTGFTAPEVIYVSP